MSQLASEKKLQAEKRWQKTLFRGLAKQKGLLSLQKPLSLKEFFYTATKSSTQIRLKFFLIQAKKQSQ